MINVLNTGPRRHAIALAKRLAGSDQSDPSLLANVTPEQIRAVQGEMLLQAKQCVDEVERLQGESLERAREFVELTEQYIASHPLALAGAE